MDAFNLSSLELSNADSMHEQSLQTGASNRKTRTEHESANSFTAITIEGKIVGLSVFILIFNKSFLSKDHRTVPIDGFTLNYFQNLSEKILKLSCQHFLPFFEPYLHVSSVLFLAFDCKNYKSVTTQA